MIAGSGGARGQPAPDTGPSLAEAARRHRTRVAASRERHGEAPRFTDADLTGGRSRAPERSAVPLVTGTLGEPAVRSSVRGPAVRSEDLSPEIGGGDTLNADDDVRANVEARRREIAARESEIRERLLDIRASLAAVGASGLPAAPRNPTRFQSALDTAQLRAEQEELGRELEALAVERRLLR